MHYLLHLAERQVHSSNIFRHREILEQPVQKKDLKKSINSLFIRATIIHKHNRGKFQNEKRTINKTNLQQHRPLLTSSPQSATNCKAEYSAYRTTECKNNNIFTKRPNKNKIEKKIFQKYNKRNELECTKGASSDFQL